MGWYGSEGPLLASVSGYERKPGKLPRYRVRRFPLFLCVLSNMKASFDICLYMSLHTISYKVWVRRRSGCRRAILALGDFARMFVTYTNLAWGWTTTTCGAAGFRVGVFASDVNAKATRNKSMVSMHRPDLGAPSRTDVDVAPTSGCQVSRHPIEAGRGA